MGPPLALGSVASSQISNLTFAILSNGHEEPLEVQYLDYEQQTGMSESVGDVSGTHLSFDHASNPDNELTHTTYLDKSSKPGKKLHKLINFLAPKHHCTASSGICNLGSCKLVEKEEKAHGANVDNFYETNFRFEADNGESGTPSPAVNDVQFLNIRSSRLKAKDSIENFESVDIISGICLFSHDKLCCLRSWILNTSKPGLIDALPASLGASLYEIDSLTRLSNTIANIIVLLPGTLRVRVIFDVPRVQYYCQFLDLLCQKHCSVDQFKLLTAVIDQRHDQLSRVFRGAVGEEIRRRGCDQSRVTLEESPGLEIVAPEILDAVFSYKDVSIESVMAKLQALDPLWRDFLELVDEHPKRLYDLCTLSYVHQTIRPVLQRARSACGQEVCNHFVPAGASDRNIGKPTRQLLLHIDSSAERYIFFHAEKLLNLHQKKNLETVDPLILGLFPSERVFTETDSGKTGLYYQAAGQTLAPAQGNAIQPMDIVTKVYGQDCTNSIRQLLGEEGMLGGPRRS